MDRYDELTYAVDGRVARITLNRPNKLNALTQKLYGELRHALTRANCEAAAEVVVLTGAGRAFCAGGDVGSMGGYDVVSGRKRSTS